jgi:hypothetical protein
MVLAAAGINVLAAGWNDRQIERNIDALFKTSAAAQPIMVAANSTAKTILGHSCMGPLMERYKVIGRDIRKQAMRMFQAGTWVQAEELIPICKTMLKDTSLIGHVTPAAPTELLTVRTFHKVSQVVGAIDRASAFYSLLETTKRTKYHSVCYQAGTFVPVLKEHTTLLSYRNIPLDGQFCDFKAAGSHYGMAFQLGSGADAHAARNLPYLRAKLTWWYDWYTQANYNWNDSYSSDGAPSGIAGEQDIGPIIPQEGAGHSGGTTTETARQKPVSSTSGESDSDSEPMLPPRMESKPLAKIYKAFGPAATLFRNALSKLLETKSIHDASTLASQLADTVLAMDPEDTLKKLTAEGVADEGLQFILETTDLITANDTRTATEQRMSGLRVDYAPMLSQIQRDEHSQEKQPAAMTTASTLEELEEKTDKDKLAAAIEEDISKIKELAILETSKQDTTQQGKGGALGSAAEPRAKPATSSMPRNRGTAQSGLVLQETTFSIPSASTSVEPQAQEDVANLSS